MADEDRRAILPVEHAVGRSDVVGERGQRVLDDRDAVAPRGQVVVDAAPARAVGERAVDQHDVLDGLVVGDPVGGVSGVAAAIPATAAVAARRFVVLEVMFVSFFICDNIIAICI